MALFDWFSNWIRNYNFRDHYVVQAFIVVSLGGSIPVIVTILAICGVEWGSVADWFSGIATFAAVLVSLMLASDKKPVHLIMTTKSNFPVHDQFAVEFRAINLGNNQTLEIESMTIEFYRNVFDEDSDDYIELLKHEFRLLPGTSETTLYTEKLGIFDFRIYALRRYELKGKLSNGKKIRTCIEIHNKYTNSFEPEVKVTMGEELV